ncbi:MAG: hypothetical protein VKK42_04475 [Lyngbya sp.]|nr:hypothetical protein [Lyngbya sp.]
MVEGTLHGDSQTGCKDLLNSRFSYDERQGGQSAELSGNQEKFLLRAVG